jgi:hypothetical protein
MNKIRIALPPVLFFSLLTFGYAQPQDSGQQPDSPKQEETKHPEDAAPPHKPAEAKPPKPEKPDAPKPPKHQPKDQPQAGQEERQENHGQANQGHDEHGQAQRADDAQKRQGGKSARVPDAQFKAKLGHQHSFKVNRVVTQTTVVPNRTQFVYEGYSFVFLDPWPADWMFTDDCYIDYVDDQYFLFDPLHPEVRVALLIAE